ncbi:ABC transporter permease [Actinomadura harenae]|uniref:ABC transporter permease n=1 Tax=Actinomadura harenae TaxID=2483351 RepID=A0A3M2MH33_9ACTN|nr:ABC transporter permease [Actinomadura harenae]RMI46558.1 ABC transporter permease [Actinomadura harenae]
MSALGGIVRSGVARKRVQTLVLTLTTMLAVTASVLAMGLITASQGPFDHAFARQHGAQLTARFDGNRATPDQLAATVRASGVTAAAGPFAVLTLRPSFVEDADPDPAAPLAPPMTIAGRPRPDGPVDDVDLVQGRWATAPGEIVLDFDGAPVPVGHKVAFTQVPGRPTLTVVGRARSIGRSADAWVAPAEVPSLTSRTPEYQMLYRFKHAATDAQVSAGKAAVAAAAPRGALTGTGSYLSIRHAAQRETATFVPFIVAFGILALVMSVLTIGVVVNAAVAAATHRIGVLKSLGFTPAQVVTGYVGKALIPAAIGTGLGVVFGNLLAIPTLRQEATAYQAGAQTTVAPWIDVAVPVLALAAVALTALVPALRAGRLRAAEAIAVGRAPRPGRGRAVRRVLGGLPLSRPLALGLAAPFARPARSVAMGLALMLGTASVAFGVGLALSLNGIQNGIDRNEPGAVIAHTVAMDGPGGAPPAPPAPGPTQDSTASQGPASAKPHPHRTTALGGGPRKPADRDAVARLIEAQPGTGRYFSTSDTRIGLSGLTTAVPLVAYTGDASWGALQMVSGRWFHGAGEAVVPSGLLKATGTRVGDTLTLTNAGRTAGVRIVGEVLSTRNDGMDVMTDAASVAALGVRFDTGMTEFQIDPRHGTDTQSYATALNTALAKIGASARPNDGPHLSTTVVAMDALAGTMTLLLVTVAGLGVLNTVVLDTRERVRDLGIMKALGMAPREVVAMIVTTVGAVGVCFAAAGIPIGMALHAAVLPLMGKAAGTGIPAADTAVFHLPLLGALLLGGVLIAVAGALLPAGWAARTRTSTALRTE